MTVSYGGGLPCPICRRCRVLARSWARARGMPGRRPRKADCTVGSTAGNVAVVVVPLFGHADGVERTMGVPGVGGASALVAPRSCFGNLPRWLRAAKFSGRGVRMLPGESSAPRRQRRRCLRVSQPSWGRRCGHPPCGTAPGENLDLAVSTAAA
jgi:hypothetical protein